MLKQRLWPINPTLKKDATKLLLHQARQLYEFDFNNIKTSVTAEQTSQFSLLEWLSKSHALDKWNQALNQWQQPLKLQRDELKDAVNALTALLTELNVVKAIWNN